MTNPDVPADRRASPTAFNRCTVPDMLRGTGTPLSSGFRRAVLGAVIGLAIVLVTPPVGLARLRPIARAMLEALATVNLIGQGIAVGDYETSERAARSLRNQATNLKKIDIEIFGIDPAREAEFDEYLTVMANAAVAIANAAKKEDARAALRGLEHLFQSACLACHREFREPANLLRPPVIYMMNFLNAWNEMNRGLAMNSFEIVERQAREIAAAVRTLQRDSVIETTFDIHEPKEREEFEAYLRQLNDRAGEIERAAVEKDAKKATRAMRKMWEDGCISCHEEFREGQPSSTFRPAPPAAVADRAALRQ